ncbi:hypothetical protein K504DRAFT_496422 [Pleomassaria siparia CBS 279.74]|uniref:Uncharacterized protein n=1 Tax=Pleomassaria siparia CBS 279.74 TaxID=1314801 RepID=A0A6G1KPC3_9PLEO|nr:hypothetical protein K504DRAFT_496422 [Pleomassaria siparia CBS 279.74]
MLMKTLRQGFGSDNVVSSMTLSLTNDAQKEPTLLDWATYNTNSGEFKAAKKRTFANKGLKLRTSFVKPEDTGRASTPMTPLRTTRRGSTASNRSAGATAMSRLSLFSTAAEPSLLTAPLFSSTRMNFFVLPNRYRLFSLRVSSVIKAKYKDIVSRQMQGEIKHSSLDFNAFRRKVNGVVTDETLANAGRNAYLTNEQQWNFVIAHYLVTKEDDDFRQFCDAVRKGDVAKRETISRELHPKLPDNPTTQGLTGPGKAETPPRSPADPPKIPATGKAPVPPPYILPPTSVDTPKIPTRRSESPKSTNTPKTSPGRDLPPKSTNIPNPPSLPVVQS